MWRIGSSQPTFHKPSIWPNPWKSCVLTFIFVEQLGWVTTKKKKKNQYFLYCLLIVKQLLICVYMVCFIYHFDYVTVGVIICFFFFSCDGFVSFHFTSMIYILRLIVYYFTLIIGFARSSWLTPKMWRYRFDLGSSSRA